ncbi:hypothetical protein M3Y98_00532100 [Aphelenchoides besseyi]|nr:hypothetical protein M3Y98_00532100 [Aphelenchoides besseyi]KAI6208054.1 hypothetical protein M3Y96_00074000 [Aphelenchoides besseyi]
MSEPVVETPVAEEVPSREEQLAELENLFNDGRKAFVLKDWLTASEKLSSASELSVQLHGEFAPETYNPHYFYGSTLLELASVEREILDAKEDENEEESEARYNEIKEELKSAVLKVMEATATSTENPDINEKPVEEKLESVKNNEDQEKKEKQPENMETVAPVEAESTETEVANEVPVDKEDQHVTIDLNETLGAEEAEEMEQEVEDEEENTNQVEQSQLVFEILDYARLVCEKQPEKTAEWLKREWEVRVLLAQCAMNDGNLDLVVQEYSKALSIIRSHFPEERREISFICMEMNRANRQAKKFDLASENLDDAIKALEEFKVIKQTEVETATEEEKPKLTELVTEVEEMISDLRDEKRMNETIKADAENKENADTKTTMPTSKMDDAPIEIVSYKRKAKNIEASEDEINDHKKPKLDSEEQATA